MICIILCSKGMVGMEGVPLSHAADPDRFFDFASGWECGLFDPIPPPGKSNCR